MSIIEITCHEALAMQHAGALILDVREPWETQLAGIDDALNIPMQMIPDALKTLPADQDILCLCHHGIRSRHVAVWLAQQGFSKLYNIKGGISAWSREVDPTIASY